MILIYSPYQSARLDYILKFIFGSLMGTDYRLTNNLNEYKSYSGPRLSYSKERTESGIWVSSTEFLFSDKIIPIEPTIAETTWGKIIFQVSENTRIPFDIFAASFYLISRYEEYLPFEPDKHGRFNHTSSVLYKADLISKPIINIWVNTFKKILNEKYSELKFNSPTYKFIATIDIDNAFAYREKGFFRTAGGYFRSLLHGKFSEITARRKVIHGKETDPYDTYDFIKQIHKKNAIVPKIFVLNGKYGKYDKNISAKNPAFIKVLKELSATSEMGIHPSYCSNSTASLTEEKNVLEKILGINIFISRQHFLMLRFPETYISLIKNGITADYSMGYSTITGYRAGTCSSFPFFDLKTNQESSLIIFPFAWMDRTLLQHMKLTPSEAENYISENISQIKELGGTFISLWHNESLNNKGSWKGWLKVYEHMMNYAKS